MKLRFQTRESAQDGLFRLAVAEAGAIAQRVHEPCDHTPQDVHAVRLATKRFRAWWHLLRPFICESEFQAQNGHLREAAESLAPQRDCRVALETLSVLRDQAGAGGQQAAVDACIQALTPACNTSRPMAFDAPTELALRKGAHALADSAAALARLPLAITDDWDLLQPGLAASYSRTCRAMRRARHRPTVKDFHIWRTQVKRLYYQLDLLRPVWPGHLKRLTHRLKKLGDLLGEDHDLWVLQELLASQNAGLTSDAIEPVLHLICRRTGDLRRRCLHLGRRALDDKPRTFLRKLGRHYRDWHLPAPVPTAASPVAAA